MIDIVILGAGNVASHFIHAFSQSQDINISQIYNHRPESLRDFSDFETTKEIDKIKTAEVYLVCIKDDKVQKIVQSINQPQAIIAHTSGSLPLLKTSNRDAVFYPLQTFSKDKTISFKDLPICLETEYESDFKVLKKLVHALGAKPYAVSTIQRQELHLAAVFVCNFVNHLYHIGHEICAQKNLPFDILKPLIKETADKINFKTPNQAQTGPAIRHDQTTINRHIQQLDNPNYQEIYRYLTNSIQKSNE
ncbi:Rossmann-like and DUF2520 domain-containing protein [Flavobacteriaceae bacterium 14752]|uniref:Rossmann-like and DUF2520 domain-containing protein n=1 Tax=Mesohalobacter salilacus TaxID=2491711 RepID=UPI000F63AEAB|nr:DUF2520 domain-containing protein [Flavobacteriaceae bacterium 14752]